MSSYHPPHLQEPDQAKWGMLLLYWSGTTQCSLSSFDRVQKDLNVFVGDKGFYTLQALSCSRTIASLSFLYPYFYGKYSNELHSFVPSALTFTATTHHATHILANHLIPLVFHWSDINSTRTGGLWIRVPVSPIFCLFRFGKYFTLFQITSSMCVVPSELGKSYLSTVLLSFLDHIKFCLFVQS